MKVNDLREKYIQFFVRQGHKEIPSASLVPQNDPTTLFTGSGMQPMLPYLLGEKHPFGTKIVDSQKCFRSQDIEEVGDNRHTTFFEMLGNWSLGDYWKKEQLRWFFEFLTDWAGLNPKKLYVTVMSEEKKYGIPKDSESVAIWKQLFSEKGIIADDIALITDANGYEKGMQDGRIFYYNTTKNWWSRAGIPDNMPIGEPGGPDSEVFYEFTSVKHDNSYGKYCHPNCDCGRFLEIGNSVFMEYKRTKSGFEKLQKQNVDFGGGFERIMAVANDDPDVFKTSIFTPLIEEIERISGKKYTDKDRDTQYSFRVISDHVKAATMLAADGVFPSNKEQGYFSRRLLRRAIRYAKLIGIKKEFLSRLVPIVAGMYKDIYPEVDRQTLQISNKFSGEEARFRQTLGRGLREFDRLLAHKKRDVKGKKTSFIVPRDAFYLYETYGFPYELIIEIAREKGIELVSTDEFKAKFDEYKKSHADKSRTAAEGRFKGGLADHSKQTTRLHTAHHLLLAALQHVIDPTIRQRGSNITNKRLRIDVSFSRKITSNELKQVEELVNKKITDNLSVVRHSMKLELAKRIGAQMEFGQKYPDEVVVYFIGLSDGVLPEDIASDDFFSAEFCGGPHVSQTGEIGGISITKEKSASAGIRRIYAVLKK